MSNPSAGIVILITLIIVVGINFMIVFMVKNRKPTKSNNIVSGITKQMRNPYQKEDNDLKDLSDLVEKIQDEINSEN
jgi:hypothetical protein